MADPIQISEIQDLMPGGDEDWDEAKISSYLDADKTVPECLQLFWESRASRLHTMIDISESGSSRSLSRLYDNALKLAEYWAGKVEKDKEAAKEEQADLERRISFNTINRV